MRLIASLLLFFVAACVTARAPASNLDQLAEAYVRLALDINVIEDGYVDSYTGPPEWRAEAEARRPPRSTAELRPIADQLVDQLTLAQTQTADLMDARRARYLAAAVRSARFRLDMIDGRRAPFADEAERLFALRPPLQPLESYEPAIARIEALAPGEGPLSERVEALRMRYAVPADRLQAVMDAAIAECRARTQARLMLPANESFRMEFVTGQSWSAYNWYQGDAQSLIQVNTDLPVTVDRALGLGCHEGYPGHHVQGIYSERLYRERGWIEFSVAPLYSPSGPLNEGGGNYGVELAFPGEERAAFERDVLYPLAGLDPASAASFNELHGALSQLAGARLTISAMYLDGEITRERAIELAQRYQLISAARAAQSMDFTEHYRSYVINYATGEDVVRAYVERFPPEERWAAFERIMLEPTLPSDLMQ